MAQDSPESWAGLSVAGEAMVCAVGLLLCLGFQSTGPSAERGGAGLLGLPQTVEGQSALPVPVSLERSGWRPRAAFHVPRPRRLEPVTPRPGGSAADAGRSLPVPITFESKGPKDFSRVWAPCHPGVAPRGGSF